METVSEFTSTILKCIHYKIPKLSPIWLHSFPVVEASCYVSLLTLLTEISTATTPIELSPEDKERLCSFFQKAFVTPDLISNYDFFIHSQDNKGLSIIHNTMKAAFSVYDNSFFVPFIDKLNHLSATHDPVLVPDTLDDSQKISLNDFSMMLKLTSAKNFLAPIANLGIGEANFALQRWLQIEGALKQPFFERLNDLCKKSRPPGTIFLGDNHTIQLVNDPEYTSVDAIKKLFMGRIVHVGIYVNPDDKELQLSHVNHRTNTHAVRPVYNLLFLPFSFALSLDISPLIPTHLPAELKTSLQRIFLEEFQRLAAEQHEELPLGKSKEHFKALLEGHISPVKIPLDQLVYPPANTPIFCSAYVGITFLLAIEEVNKALEEFGFDERIPHPFGEYENPMNLDILRLLYLWKKIEVIKVTPLHSAIHKVVSSSCESVLRETLR